MSDLLVDHYRTLIEDRGYERAGFAVGGLEEPEIRRRFAFADRGREFVAAHAAGERSLVTVGVSMTGPPHVGTLGQLLTAVRFQEAGFDVQLILADLAAYNAAGRDLREVRALARRYRRFALDLGFDPDAGILRTQEEATGVLHTAQLLSRYFDPDAGGDDPPPTAFEAALADAYEATDTPGAETTRFAGQQVGLLLVADTIHPAVADDYENLLFVGGADNHGLTGYFRDVLAGTPYEARIAGLYTKLVPGLEGYPKMSKSIPDSRLSLDADPDAIRDQIVRIDDGDGPPEHSPVFTMLCLASPYSATKLDRLAERCDAGDVTWNEAKREYAAYLVEVAETWTGTDD